MILTAQEHTARNPDYDPFTKKGAQNIAQKHKADCKAMIVYMDDQQARHDAGWSFLSRSPLAQKLWVASAMVTLGLVEEGESENGSCMLRLTDLSRGLLEAAP